MEGTTIGRTGERPPALAARTACESFQITAGGAPERVALRTKGDEVSITWGEYAERVRALAAGLAALGVERGDTVALMLTNRPEFHLADSAAMHLGAVGFSIYNTYTPEQIEFLVGDAANRVVITEQAFLDRFLAVRGEDNAIEHVVVVDGEAPEGVMTLDELAGRGAPEFDFEAAWRAVEPDDVLTLIYTSGTTGPPKGVQITHANICETVRSYDQVIAFSEDGRVVSYLPMAHVAERNVSHYLGMLLGFTVTCCPDPREIAQYLPEVHPTWFFGVPRIFEKVKAGLEAMLAGLPEGEQKDNLQGALDLSLQRVKLIQAGEPVPSELEQRWQEIDTQVLSNIRAMLGFDQLEACNVGAAPTPPEVIEFFHALGIPLAELWGMSETTGAGCCNPPEQDQDRHRRPAGAGHRDQARRGRRGPDPRPGDHGRLSQPAREDARDLHRRRLPDDRRRGRVRRRRLPQDRRSQEGADHQRGRQEHVAGQHRVEAQGGRAADRPGDRDRRRAPVQRRAAGARSGRRAGAERRAGRRGLSVEQLAADERVVAKVAEEVERANEHLARVEQIKRFTLLPTEWQPGGEELTPTMKLKRKPIAARYAQEIEALYAG